MKLLCGYLLAFACSIITVIRAQQDVYEVSVITFNMHEIRPLYLGVPLYCKISPEPHEPLIYHWSTSTHSHHIYSEETSPYAQYKPKYNHPQYGRVFCSVYTESQQLLGTGDIMLKIQEYIKAKGFTRITFKPPNPLTLTAEIPRQYSHHKSPLLNIGVFTQWTHNEEPIEGEREQITTSSQQVFTISSTQEADAGVYKLNITHFFIRQGVPDQNDEEQTATSNLLNRHCSGIVLDTLGLYAIFNSVEFQVTTGTSGTSAPVLRRDITDMPTIHYYKFFKGKELFVSIQIPLQPIRGLDYQILMDSRSIQQALHLNGKHLFETTELMYERIKKNEGPLFHIRYSLVSQYALELELTFPTPEEGTNGVYEYQIYVDAQAVYQYLNTTKCNESYQNFLIGGIRLPVFLVGKATINVTIADRVEIIATRTNFMVYDEERTILSCSPAQKNVSTVQLSWFKNNQILVATTSSSTLDIDIKDVTEVQDLLSVYGTYKCTIIETDGQHGDQTIHIAEKAPFSLQLYHGNGLDCTQTSTKAIEAALLQELQSIFSGTCDCEITTDNIVMATMSCDNGMLVLSAELIYSDQNGDVTASNLLSSAAHQLMGIRVFDDVTVVIDTECPLRDSQENCIEGQENAENQITLLAIVLLVLLILLLIGIVTTVILIGCRIGRQRKVTKEHTHSPSNHCHTPTQSPSHRPITSPEISNDPQPYSYPQVHAISGKRALSFGGQSNHQILRNIRSNSLGHQSHQLNQIVTTENGIPKSVTAESEYASIKMETSMNCIPNPSYNTTNNESNQNDKVLSYDYQSICHHRGAPRGRIKQGQHIYDYPTFEGQEEPEQETSVEESYYI